MRKVKFARVTVLLTLLLTAGLGVVAAQETHRIEIKSSPIAYTTEFDGTSIPVYLMPENTEVTQKALDAGFVTLEEVEKAREFESEYGHGVKIPLCSSIAVQRGAGRDADNDYYKDYEHPEDWTYGYCVTAWYALFKGSPNSFLLAPHYGPHLFRRRMIIGLSGFPDWFANQQAYLRVWQ